MDRDHDPDPPGPNAPRPQEGNDATRGAWRLTFEYRDDTVRLVAQQRVAMLAPPDDSEALERGRAGYWVEVRDQHDRPLYSQVLHDPIQTDYEVFSPEPGAIPQRVEAPEIKGVFQAVVPDLPEAIDVVLHGRANRRELADQAAQPLVRAALRETPPPKAGGR